MRERDSEAVRARTRLNDNLAFAADRALEEVLARKLTYVAAEEQQRHYRDAHRAIMARMTSWPFESRSEAAEWVADQMETFVEVPVGPQGGPPADPDRRRAWLELLRAFAVNAFIEFARAERRRAADLRAIARRWSTSACSACQPVAATPSSIAQPLSPVQP